MTTIVIDNALVAKLRAVGSSVVTAVDDAGNVCGQILVFDEPDPVLIVELSDVKRPATDH